MRLSANATFLPLRPHFHKCQAFLPQTSCYTLVTTTNTDHSSDRYITKDLPFGRSTTACRTHAATCPPRYGVTGSTAKSSKNTKLTTSCWLHALAASSALTATSTNQSRMASSSRSTVHAETMAAQMPEQPTVSTSTSTQVRFHLPCQQYGDVC
jgi:hypothetical protein